MGQYSSWDNNKYGIPYNCVISILFEIEID